MLLEHERNYGLGMDAAVIVCSWNTNGIMVWAWMLRWAYALETRTELWFGNGCCGEHMLLNTNGIMVWASPSQLAALHYGGAFARRARRICGLNGSVIWPAQGIQHVVSCGATSGLRAKP